MYLRILATALFVAGCSGSSSTDEGPEFSELSNAFDGLNTTIDALPATATMPVSGSATYAGLARIDYALDGAQRIMVGEAQLIADFGRGTASGALTDFVDEREGVVDGSIAMGGGTISGNRIDGLAVEGTLAVGDRDLGFEGTGRGQFRGADATSVRVEMGGRGDGANRPDWTGAAYLDR